MKPSNRDLVVLATQEEKVGYKLLLFHIMSFMGMLKGEQIKY